MEIKKIISFLEVGVTQDEYKKIHHEFRAHSFHNTFHDHMYVEFGKHDELNIVKNISNEIATNAIDIGCGDDKETKLVIRVIEKSEEVEVGEIPLTKEEMVSLEEEKLKLKKTLDSIMEESDDDLVSQKSKTKLDI